MARYFLEVAYDGTAFHGSQIQGEQETVQLYVNKAISTLIKKDIITFGASRTDEGVHARCNFYHFDIEGPLLPNFLYKVNAILPPKISANAIYLANDPELNARFAALSRQYRYRIYKKKDPFLLDKALFFPFHIDRAVLDETASVIKDYEDFESFSKRNSQVFTFKCNIIRSYWEDKDDELHYVVEANRFLRGMVRGLVGTQLQVAAGKNDVAGFRSIIEAKDCTKAYFNVAGHGLYLEKINYPEESLTEVKDTLAP